MYLDDSTFKTVVSSTPLVSIDLVIRDAAGRALLGLRTNRPAQNQWFVPGGRVLKNERLAEAFTRLVAAELGVQLSIDRARLLGVYDHLYSDSIWGDSVSTHYVVTAFELDASDLIATETGGAFSLDTLPDKQHADYRWFEVDTLLRSDQVHEHTKWYFTKDIGFK